MLVSATLAGDTSAFEVLVRRYRRTTLARALAIVGDGAEAEDVVQDAFVRAYTQLAYCRAPDRFAAWLLAIVQRTALNAIRSRVRRRTTSMPETIPAAGRTAPDYQLAREERRQELLRALEQISQIQREVVLLGLVCALRLQGLNPLK